MKILPKSFFSQAWLKKIFKNNYQDSSYLFDKFYAMNKKGFINTLSIDNNTGVKLFVTNLVLYIHKTDLSDSQKKEYIEFFLFNFLSDYFKESEIIKTIHEITILLEKYEIPPK